PSRMPTLRTASMPVSGSMTRPPSSTRSYCGADARVVDNARKRRKKIRLRMVAPSGGMIAGRCSIRVLLLGWREDKPLHAATALSVGISRTRVGLPGHLYRDGQRHLFGDSVDP